MDDTHEMATESHEGDELCYECKKALRHLLATPLKGARRDSCTPFFVPTGKPDAKVDTLSMYVTFNIFN
jgi:hypothetical protein